MKRNMTVEEIKKKLQWFHGEEFEKYPFIDRREEGKSSIKN